MKKTSANKTAPSERSSNNLQRLRADLLPGAEFPFLVINGMTYVVTPHEARVLGLQLRAVASQAELNAELNAAEQSGPQTEEFPQLREVTAQTPLFPALASVRHGS